MAEVDGIPLFTAVKMAEAVHDMQCASGEGDASQAAVTGTQARSVEPIHTSNDGTRMARHIGKLSAAWMRARFAHTNQSVEQVTTVPPVKNAQ